MDGHALALLMTHAVVEAVKELAELVSQNTTQSADALLVQLQTEENANFEAFKAADLPQAAASIYRPGEGGPRPEIDVNLFYILFTAEAKFTKSLKIISSFLTMLC